MIGLQGTSRAISVQPTAHMQDEIVFKPSHINAYLGSEMKHFDSVNVKTALLA